MVISCNLGSSSVFFSKETRREEDGKIVEDVSFAIMSKESASHLLFKYRFTI
jgi:hypothetical protein